MLRGSDLVRHPLRPVLRYTKAILLEIAYGGSLGRTGDRRFRPDGREPAQNPKTDREIEELNQSRSHERRLMRHKQGWFPINRVA